MTKYLLVKVKKPFGYYKIGTELTMRESLVKGIFKDKVKVLKEANEDNLTKVSMEIEETSEVETPKKKNTNKKN